MGPFACRLVALPTDGRVRRNSDRPARGIVFLVAASAPPVFSRLIKIAVLGNLDPRAGFLIPLKTSVAFPADCRILQIGIGGNDNGSARLFACAKAAIPFPAASLLRVCLMAVLRHVFSRVV